jgi:hypothetical protein
MKLLLYPTVLVESILHLNYEYRNLWSLHQVKFALSLVQKWPYQNEVIDLGNKNISQKLLHQKCHISKPFQQLYPKRVNILLQSNFEGSLNYKFQTS